MAHVIVAQKRHSMLHEGVLSSRCDAREWVSHCRRIARRARWTLAIVLIATSFGTLCLDHLSWGGQAMCVVYCAIGAIGICFAIRRRSQLGDVTSDTQSRQVVAVLAGRQILGFLHVFPAIELMYLTALSMLCFSANTLFEVKSHLFPLAIAGVLILMIAAIARWCHLIRMRHDRAVDRLLAALPCCSSTMPDEGGRTDRTRDDC